MKQQLLAKIASKSAVIGVIGLGYVGLPLASECVRNGFQTFGFEKDEKKIKLLSAGKSYIKDVPHPNKDSLSNKSIFHPTSDFSKLAQLDVIFICVPTPLNAAKQPDTSAIHDSADVISRYMKAGSVIILESTSYPGTTRELLKSRLEVGGLICNRDFYLGFSPERIDPGNPKYKLPNTPKIVGGLSADATEVIIKMYQAILSCEVLAAPSPEVAEMGKLLENSYRNINIALVNEMTILCEQMQISIWDVIEASKTKPYGFQSFVPGPGVGGHCIPIDPVYLSWKAKEYGTCLTTIDNAILVNEKMPNYIVKRVLKILEKRAVPTWTGHVLVLGIAYKENIADDRESPAVKILNHLRVLIPTVDYYDPYIPAYEEQGHTYKSLPQLDAENLQHYDLVVITTGHADIDYAFVQKEAQFIFDTRNATQNLATKKNIEYL